MCVSNCTCYDGINVTTDNETTQVFDGYDVTDQGNVLASIAVLVLCNADLLLW